MEELVCNICHEDIREGNEVGEINSCNHRFCHPCIAKWATIENSCPCCKLRFDVIVRKQASCTPGRLANLAPNAPIPGKVLGEERCEQVNQRPIFEDPSFEEWIQNVVCLVCGNAENEDQLLLCDDCDGACHTYCVGLNSIPEGEWFCSACSARRARAEQRQRRRAQQQQQAEQRTRRRRRRNVINSDDDDEEDNEVEIVEIRSGSRRQDAQRRRRGGSGNANDDLDGFIVSDSEDQSSDSEDEEELGLQERLRRRQNNGGGPSTRRARGGGSSRRQQWQQQAQRERHERAMQAALDSDFEEEIDWAEISDEEEEDLFLDSPAVVAAPTRRGGAAAGDNGGWRRVRRGNDITTTTTRTTRASQQPRQRQRRQQNQEDVDPVSPRTTTARHAVEVLTENWEQIRRGTTSFNQVLANTTTNNRRSRQGRQAVRERATTRATTEAETVDVIDLSDSPAADGAAGATTATARPGLSPPLGITSLSSRLRAELNACREKGSRLPRRTATKNNNNSNTTTKDSEADIYFAAADAAATLNTNNNNNNNQARQVPYSSTPRGSASWRLPHNLGSPGSSGQNRMRTVRDVHRGAEVARRTPNSGGGGGSMRPPPPVAANRLGSTLYSPAPLQQRLAARAAAEWGQNALGNGSGSKRSNAPEVARPPWRQVKRTPPRAQQQQQQQQVSHRPFRPMVVTDTPTDAGPSSLQRQQQQQEQQPPVRLGSLMHQPYENRDVPMFLRNKMDNKTSNPEQNQLNRVQSPNYSPPKLNNTTNAPTPPAANSSQVKNSKQQAYDAVRSHLRLYLQADAITREQYKKIARAATRKLYELHGGAPPDDEPASQEVALVVDEALVAVISGKI